MISTLAWVPKGVPKALPEPAPPTEEELEAMRAAAAQSALRRGNRGAQRGGGGGGNGGGSSDDDDEDASMSDDEDDDGDDEDASEAVERAKRAAALLAGGADKGGGGKGAAGAKKSSSSSASAKPAATKPQSIDEALRELDVRFPDEAEADPDAARAALIGRAFRTLADGPAEDLEGGDDEGAVEDADGDGADDAADDDAGAARSGDDSEDADAFAIRPSDMLILAGRHEDDVSTLEVWLYEEASAETGGEANLYVHHDLLLPSFPLCAARVDLRPAASASAAASGGGGGGGKKGGDAAVHGNLVAVGTMEPGIDVWDLDVLDAVEPLVTLGGFVRPRSAHAAAEEEEGEEGEGDDDDDDDDEDGDGAENAAGAAAGAAAARRAKAKKARQSKKSKDRKRRQKEARRKPRLREGSHEGAVLCVAWNPLVRNALASGGADATVKLWDLSAGGACSATLAHHRGKVQAVAWNPAEAPVLLTGAFDRTCCVVDARAAAAGAGGGGGSGKKAPPPPTWQTSADVEAVAWSPSRPTSFVVSSEDGLVACFDTRAGAGSKPLWRLSAHDKPACALSFCPQAPGLLATASTDKTAKLWDVSADAPSAPLASSKPDLGALFAAAFCGADAPHLLAMGGAKGAVGVWDVRSVKAVAERWPGLMEGATFLEGKTRGKRRQGGRRGQGDREGGGGGGGGSGDSDGMGDERDHEEGVSTDDEE